MNMDQIDTFYPRNREEWRQWLEINHREVDAIWLIYFKKNSGIDSVSYSDAVEEALCFGWIDSKVKRIDNLSHKQYFCKRKAKSVWSKINKERVGMLIEKGLMRESGFEIIEKAKMNGNWNMLDAVDDLIPSDELTSNLKNNPDAELFFNNLPNSTKKTLLQWLAMAKLAETKTKRINEIIENSKKYQLPKQFNWLKIYKESDFEL